MKKQVKIYAEQGHAEEKDWLRHLIHPIRSWWGDGTAQWEQWAPGFEFYKDFFVLSRSFGFGHNANNWVNLGPLRFKLGFFFDISVVSILGLFVSWYLLRYFK